MIKPLVLDFETSISKSIHGAEFRDPANDFYTIIYGTTPKDIVISHSPLGFKRKLPEEFNKSLEGKDYLVGHNLGFDLAYVWHNESIKQFILRGGKIWDTQVAEYLLTGMQHTFASLADLQEKHLGQKQKIDRISYLYKKGVGADRILTKKFCCTKLFSMYEHYCQLDGSTTLEIFKKQYIQAKKENMLSIIELYNDYLLGIINMTCTGIELDVPLAEKTLQEFSLKHLDLLEQAQNLIKPIWDNPRLPKFNINSNDHKSAILFGGEIKNNIRTKVGKYKNGKDKYKLVEHKVWVNGFGVPKSLTTESKKKGVYKNDDGVMQKIYAKTSNAKLRQYCELQRDAMMWKKAANTYVKAFLDRCVAVGRWDLDGCAKIITGYKLFPNFNNTNVVTGRLSSSQPNFQNISNKNETGEYLHKLLIAPQGWKCVSVDYAQLEIWVSAFLSNDENLINDLQSGVDMHCVRVSYMHDISYEQAYQYCKVDEIPEYVKYRKAAKTFSYQRAYGAGVNKLVEFTGLDRETILKMIDKENERYPKASFFYKQVQEEVEKTKQFSRAVDTPSKQRTSQNTHNGYNLLKIFDKFGNTCYNKNEYEKVGYWKSLTGKKYHFKETGQELENGEIRRSITPTIMKNYPCQGAASDIQGATTAELLKVLLQHPDKIKMINEVHDSKWFYVNNEYLDKSLAIIKETMENIPKIFLKRFNINVPFRFPVDIETGDNFADMQSYKLREDNQDGYDNRQR